MSHVWVSDCREDSTLIIAMKSDLSERSLESSAKASLMSLLGQTVPFDLLPQKFWEKPKYPLPRRLPNFFVGNGNWIVSWKAADIIARFDLGDGGLYPVEIFQSDRTTPVEGEFLCLNVGAQKSAFLPERSPRALKQPGLEDWTLPGAQKDDVFHVSTAANDGPDVWWDPRVRSGFFVSQALGDALKKARMAKAFRLYRCPVVEV
jgi:hypothetical protein